MISKILRIFPLFAVCTVLFMGTAFAEGDVVCSGKLVGTTSKSNPNAGQIYFNAHPAPAGATGVYNVSTDLSIAGLATGLAPGSSEYAACTSETTGSAIPLASKEYRLEGYAWNDNLGFISFYCGADHINPAATMTGKPPVNCGAYEYGVTIGPVIGGVRKLSGYAWNDAFGYLQFNTPKYSISGSYNIGVLAEKTMILDGNEYTLLLSTVASNELSAIFVVNGETKTVYNGETTKFNDAYVDVLNLNFGGSYGPSGSMDFNLIPTASLGEYYEVTMDSSGNLSGYVWSEAGVWVNFNGVQIQLPEEEVEDPFAGGGENWCDQPSQLTQPGCCVVVTPDPDRLTISTEVIPDEGVKIADGDDSYQIHLYLKKSDGAGGVLPLSVSDISDISLNFEWEDTVKLNQLAGATQVDFSSKPAPYSSSGNGGVVFKPVILNGTRDFGKAFQQVSGDPGHYILKNNRTIRSYAPTSNTNISYTTSTTPQLPFNNEVFLAPLTESSSTAVWTDTIIPNTLTLKSISLDLTTTDGQNISQVAYPNGKNGLSFKFRPAIELDVLYANDLQDTILGYRNIPVNFKVGMRNNSSTLHYNPNSGNGSWLAKLYLDYARVQTEADGNCQDDGTGSPVTFNFDFLNSVGETTNDYYEISDINDVLTPKDLQAKATLTADNDDLPCMIAQGPTLYSEISYKVIGASEASSKDVAYYNNKLPRLNTSLENPAVVVHGNIYASRVFSPVAGHRTQAVGDVAIDNVRNTINQNVSRYVENGYEIYGDTCEITELYEGDDYEIDGCDGVQSFSVGDETVLYFKNKDVRLNLDKDGGNSVLENKWALILEGGNLFIDDDVYTNPVGGRKLSIAVLRPYGETCSSNNIYINSNVKNIQANIVADCSLFSYDSVAARPDSVTGLPGWDSFAEMIGYLDNQLLIEGNVASRNTIGGRDLTEYLLLGSGETIPIEDATLEDMLAAQIYDLNYLRLFKLDIAVSDNGLPIDQRCQKALTIDDMLAINAWEAGGRVDPNAPPVYGELLDPNSSDNMVCDGINPLKVYNAGLGAGLNADAGIDGDLVPRIDDASQRAAKLGASDWKPVYIYYMAPDSFLFSQAGSFRN